ncbi:hypothetical protein R3Q06_36660, partial [Rhodococcus erythropolis]|uniref:hypothetical protein n=1 Tax=Rhodococcus erythropolis TaxID=1833 RepID=UPI00294A8E27
LLGESEPRGDGPMGELYVDVNVTLDGVIQANGGSTVSVSEDDCALGPAEATSLSRSLSDC